jgi:hypothetical protein
MTYDLPLATLNKADFAAAVTACMDAGAFARTDPLTVSPEIWTAAHGIAPLLITKPSLPWGNKMAFATRVLRSAAIGHAASAKAPTWSPGSIMPDPVETRHRR